MSAAEVEPSKIVEKNALGIEYDAACIIGNRLKDAREDSSISKEYIAKKAKIRERYIDAIELGDWDILPPGLNGRGLIRLYAKELGVPLPEFEGFSNLQTIRTEKQSENLSQGIMTRKSRYQPAAEESAEIIKIVPRSEYKSASFDENFSGNYNNFRDFNTMSMGNNKHYQTKTHHTAAIVTPKIADIIGIDLAGYDSNNTQQNLEHNVHGSIDSSKYGLNILPLAKPINKSKQIDPATAETIKAKVEEAISLPIVDKEHSTREISQNTKAENTVNEAKKIQYKKIFLYILPFLIIFTILYGFYSLNKQNRKLDSQPLLTSEKHLLSTYGQKENSLTKTDKNPAEKSNILSIQPEVTKNHIPVNQAPIAIERSAKVDILAKVKLQIEADGKEIFSGYHQIGSLEFNFKDKAEILVYDASKVKLTYGSWDHGELGWNERKRKIVLNARPYEE